MPKTSESTRTPFIPLVLLGLATLGLGPCGPIAGGALSGNEQAGPVADWSFANEIPHCQVEVRPEDPHSVTVNCMSGEQRLFVSCSDCADKTWSGHAVENPKGRIRIGDDVYPVLLTRVEDASELDSIWQVRATKLGEEASDRPDGWWAFELRSR